ncbi:hypothetical protein [Flavobacterium johnsoniae]|jgi:PBP1b-binding outer membrane lipoprotein LpoB|uniref:Lipoprotein n=2 Tax=Flavobacterium johnsoniae TaxID=986 RepID=A0A1M5NWZ3_FLAJO|nr:hypothetical protein [Flavobacterium johnsoniae]ABQ05434.1 hypothetical lipoprotein [Flavobacterium johnsoniae UW101]OXE96828.1 hypothetical protein B0A63_20230 [Flavobacterium johnsoniae UW101]WQG82763.1 hypothetical protein SR927_06500 [Flavobacterium johnsoniae UW101]SHG93985.1 hypothetical protein SAMN05444388_105153 [Flavobacterium johnsoniae]SHL57046.1 hypothetical protein SAMN05444146_4067 [Flavobacterium johnsoniae]
MVKKISQISFAIIMVLMLAGCKNTKQKLQEFVVKYNATASSFKAENVTLTTARGYINDNKIELRFETDLEQNDANKTAANISFPKLLKDMFDKNQIPEELVNEGVQFDAYFLADDNTVFVKEVITKESLPELLKE